MKLDDHQFLERINREAARTGHPLPPLADQSPRNLRVWGSFLERCLRGGVSLSDERWERVSVTSREPLTAFALSGDDGERGEDDDDFRLGLQLLMGMLGDPQD
jgi:hypothetical protein